MKTDKEKKRNFILKTIEMIINLILKLKRKKKKPEVEEELYSSDERNKLQDLIN